MSPISRILRRMTQYPRARRVHGSAGMASTGGRPANADRSDNKLPFRLLEWLSCQELPRALADQSEIESLALLQIAGLIEADIPLKQLERGHSCFVGNAIVMRVTAQGHLAIEQKDTSRLRA